MLNIVLGIGLFVACALIPGDQIILAISASSNFVLGTIRLAVED